MVTLHTWPPQVSVLQHYKPMPQQTGKGSVGTKHLLQEQTRLASLGETEKQRRGKQSKRQWPKSKVNCKTLLQITIAPVSQLVTHYKVEDISKRTFRTWVWAACMGACTPEDVRTTASSGRLDHTVNHVINTQTGRSSF